MSAAPDGVWRMLDANANRAREGARVLEDVARFMLRDASLSAAWREIRHGVTHVATLLDPTGRVLLLARSTESDVGTDTPANASSRTGLVALAQGEASRLTEALRVIEECAKTLAHREQAARASALAQRLRYQAHDLAARTSLALLTPAARVQPRLCVLLSERLCAHHAWEEVARGALVGGADMLQLREKEMDGRELLARACALVAIARDFPAAMVIINDRVDVALAGGAHGVHLGQEDLPIAVARELATTHAHRCGPFLIGVSTTNRAQANAAAEAGADYVGLGPMFATTTKDKPTLAGPEYVSSFLADASLREVPHLAIGGITPENIDRLVAVGVRGVAVSGVVCGAGDPQSVCEAIRGKLG